MLNASPLPRLACSGHYSNATTRRDTRKVVALDRLRKLLFLLSAAIGYGQSGMVPVTASGDSAIGLAPAAIPVACLRRHGF